MQIVDAALARRVTRRRGPRNARRGRQDVGEFVHPQIWVYATQSVGESFLVRAGGEQSPEASVFASGRTFAVASPGVFAAVAKTSRYPGASGDRHSHAPGSPACSRLAATRRISAATCGKSRASSLSAPAGKVSSVTSVSARTEAIRG